MKKHLVHKQIDAYIEKHTLKPKVIAGKTKLEVKVKCLKKLNHLVIEWLIS